MAPFDFKSATHFVASSDGITLQVYEFTEPTNNPSSIQKPHFKHVAKICHETSKEEGGAKTTSSYDHGRIEGREGLTMLAQHLAQLHLVVSPQGYCFQDVSEHGMYVDLEIHYLRLNDLFCWSHHGVESMASTTNTVWTRSELKHPVRKGENLLVKPMTRCVVVREDKYKELKGMLRNRDDEMEEMKGTTQELQQLLIFTMAAAIVDFYLDLYTEKEDVRPFPSRLGFRSLNQESGESLIRPFSEAEVWEVIRCSEGDKAPGPDGFSLGFFKAQWNFV
ncbi:hypothetical protein LINPERHAP1_LOCUS27288 [Linum perenne]